MTEPEWLASQEPHRLIGAVRWRLSDRKLRLSACGCVRSIAGLASDFDCRGVLDVAERFAEASTVPSDFDQAQSSCAVAAGLATGPDECIMNAAWATLDYDAGTASFACLRALLDHGLEAFGHDNGEKYSNLLRCIFGNPFRPVTVDPQWLTSTVVQLAQGLYDDRAFNRLPILADALQDAGCDNTDVLAHCRDDQGGVGGPTKGFPGRTATHARGCWVVDLVLGKT